MPRQVLLATALVFVLVASTRAETPPLVYPPWSVSLERATVKLTADSRATGGNRLDLVAVRGEWVAFQVALRSDDVPLVGVDVHVDRFLGPEGATIPVERTHVFREWLQAVDTPSKCFGMLDCRDYPPELRRRPGRYPDPLVPLDDPYREGGAPRPVGAPFDAEAGATHAVFVDVWVPRDAAVGPYVATVVVVADERYTQLLTVRLDVLDVTLPETRRVATAFQLQTDSLARFHRAADLERVTRNYEVALHEHHLDRTTIDGPVEFRFGDDGALLPVDWTAYDAVVGPKLDGSYWPDGQPPVRFDPGRFRPGHGRAGLTDEQFGAAARAFAEHLQERGWLARAWLYSADEPFVDGHAWAYDAIPADVALLAEYTDLWDGRVLATSPLDERLTGAVDIWCVVTPRYGDSFFPPPRDHAGPEEYAERLALGEELWFYVCNANYAGWAGYDIDSPLGHEPRIVKWGAWHERATGFLYWRVNYWYSDDPWHDVADVATFNPLGARNGDGILLYPGDHAGTAAPGGSPAAVTLDGPVLSYRMKMIRDGLEDWELFALAADAGLEDWTREVVGQVHRSFGVHQMSFDPDDPPWALDDETLLAARDLVARKLQHALNPATYPDPEDVPPPPDAVEPALRDVVEPPPGPDVADPVLDCIAAEVEVAAPRRDVPGLSDLPGVRDAPAALPDTPALTDGPTGSDAAMDAGRTNGGGGGCAPVDDPGAPGWPLALFGLLLLISWLSAARRASAREGKSFMRRTLLVASLALAVAAAPACKGGGEPPSPTPTGQPATPAAVEPAPPAAVEPTPPTAPPAEPATAEPATAEPAEPDDDDTGTRYTYPPSGSGPHEGFDLGALRDRMQGTWLVGGTAFSSIPHIWHVEGDRLTKVDAEGNRSERNLELLAPCYAAVHDIDGGSTSYPKFVFDGDVLYQGLGMAGVRAGDRTVACLAAGVYVLEGETCTKWNRKSFARRGQPAWESEPGECGYSDDGKTFYGDDTNSKRKVYGRETLQVRGDVLMTQQMAGNEAEKVASLDEALARQQAKVKAIEDAKKTPTDLAFMGWGLAAAPRAFEKGDAVWAAGLTRDGKWKFGAYRFDKAEGDVLTLKGAWDVFAPSAFTAPKPAPADGAAGALAKGAPVLAPVGAWPAYARFVEAKDDKVVVEYLSGRQVKQREFPAKRVLAVVSGWVFGAPAAYRDGEPWQAANVVYATGDDVYLNTKAGVTKLPRANVKLVPTKPLKKGAKVLVRESSGFSPLKFVPGKVTTVHGDGAAYTVKTDDGKVFEQSWDLVMPK